MRCLALHVLLIYLAMFLIVFVANKMTDMFDLVLNVAILAFGLINWLCSFQCFNGVKETPQHIRRLPLKTIFLKVIILCFVFAAGCQYMQTETMVLLDEKISEVRVSKSNGFGEMNEDYIRSFKDSKSLNIFEKAITTAVRMPGDVDMPKPEYDIIVEYEKGLPPHGIHLWLGEEKSTLMYVADDTVVYLTSPEMTSKIRKLIFSEE